MLLVFHGLRAAARKKVVAIWRASKYLIVPSPHSQLGLFSPCPISTEMLLLFHPGSLLIKINTTLILSPLSDSSHA